MPVRLTATYSTGSYENGEIINPETNLGCASVVVPRALCDMYIRPADKKETPIKFSVYYKDAINSYVYLVAENVPELHVGEQILANADEVYINLSTPTPEDMTGAAFAASSLQVLESLMYFSKSALFLYITPQQIAQFEAMYPECVMDAYRSAVGKLTAQIGNMFNMETMLSETDESSKDDTIRWILQVLTAYNICAPSLNISEPLDNAYKEAYQTIQRLKGGMVSLEEPAPYRRDKYDANVEVITSRNKYIG